MKKVNPITVAISKPRNPLVAAGHFRRAGAHQPAGGSARQQAARSLQREMDRLRAPSP